MLFSILQAILTLSISFIALYLLRKYSKRQPLEAVDGGYEMKLPPLLLYLIGYPCLLLGLSPILALFFVSSPIQFLLPVSIISGGFIPLGLYFILICWNHKAYYNDEIIEVKNLWGKTKTLKWAEITKVTFDPALSGMLYLHTENQGKVAVSQGLKGFFDFRSTLINNTQIPLPPSLTNYKGIGL